jgi:hypothetical protein
MFQLSSTKPTVGCGVTLGVGVLLGSGVSVGVLLAVGVTLGVGVALAVWVAVGTLEAVGVALGCGVGVDVGVAVGAASDWQAAQSSNRKGRIRRIVQIPMKQTAHQDNICAQARLCIRLTIGLRMSQGIPYPQSARAWDIQSLLTLFAAYGIRAGG